MVSLDNSVFFVIYLASAYLYFPLNRRRSKYYWKSPVDKEIPLVPIFVLPYYFYLFYLPLTLLFIWLFAASIFKPVLIAFIIANFSASLFWYFFPNGVRRPKIKRRGFMISLVRDLYSADRYDTNAFPSNHVYGAIICSYYLSISFPLYALLFVIIGFLIIASTILVKQHHVLDVAGGIVWAAVSIFLASFLS